jgi:hypothetical protein
MCLYVVLNILWQVNQCSGMTPENGRVEYRMMQVDRQYQDIKCLETVTLVDLRHIMWVPSQPCYGVPAATRTPDPIS